MLAVTQFPLTDGRPFSPYSRHRLRLPDWPPRSGLNPQFVRSFGVADRRRAGPDAAWLDELSYCHAHRGLRLPGFKARRLGSDGLQLLPKCAFRRLFSDGYAVTRIEVGITQDPASPPIAWQSAKGVIAFARDILETPSSVPDGRDPSRVQPLLRQGPALARLYAAATTSSADKASEQSLELVEAGRPLLLIEFTPSELPPWPSTFAQVPSASVGGAVAVFGWVSSPWGEIGVWLLSSGTASTRTLRSLRLCLLRLHSEQQCLDGILRQFHRGQLQFTPGTAEASELEQYFNRATRVINSRSWAGIDQSAVVAAIDANNGVELKAELSELAERYQGIRRQVREKIVRYEQDRQSVKAAKVVVVTNGGLYMENDGQIITGGTFYGPVINRVEAERIDGSFNEFKNSAPPPELASAVAELHQHVKELIGKLPPENQAARGEVVSNLETLTREAAKPKPDTGVLKVTAKGLLDAAKFVAEMAVPITTAVKGVLALLGVVGVL